MQGSGLPHRHVPHMLIICVCACVCAAINYTVFVFLVMHAIIYTYEGIARCIVKVSSNYAYMLQTRT